MFGVGRKPQFSAQCKVCGAPIPEARATYGGHCGDLTCMTKLTIQSRAEKEAKMQGMWDSVTAMVAERSDAPLAAATPYQDKPIFPPEPARVEAFSASLRDKIAIAFSEDAPDPDIDPAQMEAASEPPSPAGIGACTACQGSCCWQGDKSHAFTTPEMMVRQRMQDPDLTPETLHQRYMDMIPPVSTYGACLFQGPWGCVLERAHRAPICNSFKCFSLRRIESLEKAHPGQAIAIGASVDGTTVDNLLVIDPAAQDDGPA